jgi:hypothetical protein
LGALGLEFTGQASVAGFCSAVEHVPPPGFQLSSLTVWNEGNIAAAGPLFRTNYRLDTSLPSGLRGAVALAERLLPRMVTLPVVGIGSPVMDRCAVGFPPAASLADRARTFSTLIDGLEAEAEATGAPLMAVKDMGDRETCWADPVLRGRGYARMASLPIAVLDLPFSNLEQYLQVLSASTRRNLRRKMRESARTVSFTECTSVSGLGDEIAQLYESTRANGKAAYGDFDDLSPAYVPKIVEDVKGATVLLGWVDGDLASFALILAGSDTAFAHQIGMRYPVARDNNLYFLNWIAAVRYCVDRGISRLEFGQTSYPVKLRLGCRLEPSWIYFRHSVRPINAALRYIAPRFGFDRMEPGGYKDG